MSATDAAEWAALMARARQMAELRDILHGMTAQQQAAFLRMGERLVAGVPMEEAALAMFGECGFSPEEARQKVAETVARPRATGTGQ